MKMFYLYHHHHPHHHNHHECSVQGQVLRCKHRNLGCSSAEGRSSTSVSGTKASVLNRCCSFPLLSELYPYKLYKVSTIVIKITRFLKKNHETLGIKVSNVGLWSPNGIVKAYIFSAVNL